MINKLLKILLSIICFPILIVMALLYIFITTEEDERIMNLNKKEIEKG